jgi:tungstate transport system permease protein
MTFIWQGVREAFSMLLHPTPDLLSIIRVTLELVLWATFLAMLIGLPIGVSLGLGRFRTRRVWLGLANGGLGLPPVVVGLFVALLLFHSGPFGGLHLIYTVRGMVLAQTILALPIVIALTASSVQAIDPALLQQAGALGASRWRLGGFALREARVGIFVAAMAAMGASLSEVGAVVLVGGNLEGETRTMAGAILTSLSGGYYAEGVALAIILLGLTFLLAAALTVVQHGPGAAGASSVRYVSTAVR